MKDREDKLKDIRANPAKFDEIVAQHAKKTRGLHAPAAAIEAIRMTLDTPIDEAQKKERDLFLKLVSAISRRRSATSSLPSAKPRRSRASARMWHRAKSRKRP